jgi:large subunit ribosomal protein LX
LGNRKALITSLLIGICAKVRAGSGGCTSMPNVYRVKGKMLISHDHFPREQNFNLELTASSEKEVLEKVYSLLGSRHKLKRYHIKIEEVEEVKGEPASKYVSEILELKGWSA